MNKKTNSDFIESYTDNYFLKSKKIIEKNGDIIVTYADETPPLITLNCSSIRFKCAG